VFIEKKPIILANLTLSFWEMILSTTTIVGPFFQTITLEGQWKQEF